MRTALVTSNRTGLPDMWWFEKARALGYKFQEPRDFWLKQIYFTFRGNSDRVLPENPQERVAAIEQIMREEQGDATFEKTTLAAWGSLEEWRRKMLMLDEETAKAGGGQSAADLLEQYQKTLS